jgi:acyl-CoA thioester hydrolase
VLYPADLAIELRPGRVGSASFVLEHRMRPDTADSPVFAEGAATLVWVNLAEGRSRPLPAHMRALLAG